MSEESAPVIDVACPIEPTTANGPLAYLLDIGLVFGIGALVAAALGTVLPIGGPFGIVAAVVAATWRLRVRGQNWADLGLGRRSWWRTLLISIGGWFAVTLLTALVATLVGQPDVSDFDFIRGDLGGYIFLLAVGWTTAAFGEEMIFRGFLLDRLAAILGRAWWAWGAALVVQAAVFGSLHVNQGPRGIAITGWLGLLLGGAFLLSRRNLWVAILIHGFIDTVGITFLYLSLDKMS